MINYQISCQWCGNIHVGMCSKVKAIEYFEDGTIKRVEFFESYSNVDFTMSNCRPETLVLASMVACNSCNGDWNEQNV